MASRKALVIGNTSYADQRLSSLGSPARDARDFGLVLADPSIGSFDQVDVSLDDNESTLRRKIARFLSQSAPDDLVLVYFSGHGILDEHGQLHFATRDTELDALSSTSVAAAFVRGELDRSMSRRQILILDCCNSGSFGRSSKGGIGRSVGTSGTFDVRGYGRVVITATDATEFAWDGDRVIGSPEHSLFTRCLIDGLKSGDADHDRDGFVSVDELYDHAYQEVVRRTSRQRPAKFSDRQRGQLIIAKSPFVNATPDAIDRELIERNSFPKVRTAIALSFTYALWWAGIRIGVAYGVAYSVVGAATIAALTWSALGLLLFSLLTPDAFPLRRKPFFVAGTLVSLMSAGLMSELLSEERADWIALVTASATAFALWWHLPIPRPGALSRWIGALVLVFGGWYIGSRVVTQLWYSIPSGGVDKAVAAGASAVSWTILAALLPTLSPKGEERVAWARFVTPGLAAAVISALTADFVRWPEAFIPIMWLLPCAWTVPLLVFSVGSATYSRTARWTGLSALTYATWWIASRLQSSLAVPEFVFVGVVWLIVLCAFWMAFHHDVPTRVWPWFATAGLLLSLVGWMFLTSDINWIACASWPPILFWAWSPASSIETRADQTRGRFLILTPFSAGVWFITGGVAERFAVASTLPEGVVHLPASALTFAVFLIVVWSIFRSDTREVRWHILIGGGAVLTMASWLLAGGTDPDYAPAFNALFCAGWSVPMLWASLTPAAAELEFASEADVRV